MRSLSYRQVLVRMLLSPFISMELQEYPTSQKISKHRLAIKYKKGKQ